MGSGSGMTDGGGKAEESEGRRSDVETRRREEGEGLLRYTVFLGEAIITMSNGSSHRPLPEPSTVMSRTFLLPLPHVGGTREAGPCMLNESSRLPPLPPLYIQYTLSGWLLSHWRKGSCR